MCKKIIRCYVDATLEYLPIRDRKKAKKMVTGLIYDRLEEYCEGQRPVVRDVRTVLQELGKPADLAYAYYDRFHKALFPNIEWKILFRYFVRAVTVLALILVAVGVVDLVVGVGNIRFIIAGTLLGILVVLYQMIALPGGKEYSAPPLQR